MNADDTDRSNRLSAQFAASARCRAKI